MKVLLLSPPYKAGYMRNGRCDYFSLSHAQWPPIWLCYAGALLESRKHEVLLVDAPALGLKERDALGRVLKFRPDILAVYGSIKSEKSDIAFCDAVKERLDCKIFFVGPFVSIEPGKILSLSKNIDGVIRGEFEHPLLDLAEKKNKKGICNLIWRDNGTIIDNGQRPALTQEELDRLPFVSSFYKKHIDFRKYRLVTELHPFLDIFTGRGCYWGKCIFCLWPQSFIKGPVYNARSIGNVVEEMTFIKREMPYIKEVFIQDDSMPRGRAIELSRAIIAENLRTPWSCYVRPDFDYEPLRIMKEAGCRSIHVGYESANPVILDKAQKGISVDTMTEFTRRAKKAGIGIHGDFLFGLPGETEAAIRETIKWALSLDIETAQFLIGIPYNNTLYSESSMAGEASRLGEEELEKWSRIAYRRFYLRLKFIRNILLNPNKYVFPQFRTVLKIVENMS